LTILAYAVYTNAHVKDSVTPNRWSWLIWSIATFAEAATYQAVSDDWYKSAPFIASSACCVMMTIIIWGKSSWKFPSVVEIATVAFSMCAIYMWLNLGLTVEAHMLMVAVVVISFIPTWVGAARGQEYSWAWGIWGLGDLLALIVILLRLDELAELPYIVAELICHSTVFLIASSKR
jgi:hypothetical protein